MISNPDNPTIKQIRRLRKRRERDRLRQIIVEGHRALGVAVRRRAGVSRVLHTRAAAARREDLLREARAAGASILEVSPGVMASLTSVATAPDVLGVAAMPGCTLEEAVAGLGLGVVLAGVRDPATAGSILSSCAAAGGTAAIATSGTTDLFAPKPVRSAAGAHFVLAIAPAVTADACASALRSAGVRIAVLDPSGQGTIEADGEPLAVVVGEEGRLPASLAGDPAERVAVGGAALVRPSLAAGAAVVLFEAARRPESAARRQGGENG